MRLIDTIFLASVTAAILAGCEKPVAKTSKSLGPTASVVRSSIPDTASRAPTAEEFNQTTIASAEALALNEDSSSNALDLITAKIDTTIILGAWLKSHPSDKISEVPPVSGINDPFCRGAVAQTHLMGRPLARYALFYIPALSKPRSCRPIRQRRRATTASCVRSYSSRRRWTFRGDTRFAIR